MTVKNTKLIQLPFGMRIQLFLTYYHHRYLHGPDRLVWQPMIIFDLPGMHVDGHK